MNPAATPSSHMQAHGKEAVRRMVSFVRHADAFHTAAFTALDPAKDEGIRGQASREALGAHFPAALEALAAHKLSAGLAHAHAAAMGDQDAAMCKVNDDPATTYAADEHAAHAREALAAHANLALLHASFKPGDEGAPERLGGRAPTHACLQALVRSGLKAWQTQVGVAKSWSMDDDGVLGDRAARLGEMHAELGHGDPGSVPMVALTTYLHRHLVDSLTTAH